MELDPRTVVVIDYTNYRGERSTRRIRPIGGGVTFDSNEYHPEKQWLIDAIDLDKNQLRQFALKDIHSWTPAS